MDTSETYIKMCEKAEEIQENRPELCDNEPQLKTIVGDKPLFVFTQEWFAEIHNNQGRRRVWLPRQDQLQEMLYDGYFPVFSEVIIPRFFDFWRQTYPQVPYFTSMEQLWLAFVMKEKYNKVWDGEQWTI